MVYINIPFVAENNRIDRDLVQKELQELEISDDAKWSAFEAIYNRLPRGVEFDDADLKGALQLGKALRHLGISYRESEEPEYV